MLDCKKCIDLLLNREESELNRAAAAESLMHCHNQIAKDALFTIIMDKIESDNLREESAGSLGSLWIEGEIEYERLMQVPKRFLMELTCDFELQNIILDKNKLGNRFTEFENLRNN